MARTFHRYVALGDSFTEGVGDHDPARPNGVRGWADRVAEVLAGSDPTTSATPTSRSGAARWTRSSPSRSSPALALRPDLVSVYAGGNDILRPKVDIDALVARYDAAVRPAPATPGRTSCSSPASTSASRRCSGTLRGRVATYNELVREVAETHGATVVDFWRLREYRDPRLWDVDRLHMSSAGHQRMAIAVLDALGVGHDLVPFDLAPLPEMDRRQRRDADLAWARAHAAPWVQRRLRGTSSGDGALAPPAGARARRTAARGVSHVGRPGRHPDRPPAGRGQR